jgi:hypothetical protein
VHWLLVPDFAESNPAEAVGFFRAKTTTARLPSEDKESFRSNVADLQHVNDPFYRVEMSIVGKITGLLSPTVHTFTASVIACGRGGTWLCKWERLKHKVIQ